MSYSPIETAELNKVFALIEDQAALYVKLSDALGDDQFEQSEIYINKANAITEFGNRLSENFPAYLDMEEYNKNKFLNQHNKREDECFRLREACKNVKRAL